MHSTFSYSRLAALLLPAALLMAAPQAPAPDEDETYQGEAPERYAMVRALEGEVRIRKGDLDETLSRGTPIAEGDVVESRGRGVLQLGDGSRVAFGGATRFTVAALFTDRKGEKQVLLRLDHGRIRVLLGGQSDARFRVDTPSGTATCFDKGGFTIEAERDKVVRLKVHSGRVTFANERDEARIPAGERLTVYSPQDRLDRVRGFNTYEGDEFDRWSDRAVVIQRGESWDRVPSEIRYYADELDNNGRWVQSEEFGWVWQPNGVAEDWRPYYRGRWAPYASGMTWVSDEPWAYVAYHHGRWHWNLGVGWFWIPGVYYSPAWVAWNHTPGYYGWAPLGYYNTPCHWGYGSWRGGYAWNVVAVVDINLGHVHRRTHHDVNVLRRFNEGSGGTAWTGGGRDLRAPWQRSPLIVSHAEFRNPGQIQTAFRRDVHRERLGAYERQARETTGRVVYRRDVRPVGPVEARPGVPTPGPARRPFEERPRPGGGDRPSLPRERPVEPRPQVDEKRPGGQAPRERPMESRPQGEGARERPVEPKPRVDERRPDPAPRERTFEPRPRSEERRPEPRPLPERTVEPTPRERPTELRPRFDREDRRPDPAPRERSPEPRPREERRPDPPKAVERESRPAPKPERPREERKSEGPREFRR
ncbi:MAG: FecR domain-containing protein [Holophagaceae bacterium]|uniref:FecR domain-containing protein n=1 Tax=Candidatus Geothrix odensensis TaxID=2954440 RepID=A0A936K787_9BACT|nr:FecR domain-containing protein [Candidatus Geothrix odensensis]